MVKKNGGAKKNNVITVKEFYSILGEHKEQVFARLDLIREEIHQVNMHMASETARLHQISVDAKEVADNLAEKVVNQEKEILDINKRDRWITGVTILISAGISGLVVWAKSFFNP